jgi:hypothetical protein
MTELTLTKTRLRAGVWEGILSGCSAKPGVNVLHLEKLLAGVVVDVLDAAQGTYQVRIPIPAKLLNDGVQTFVIQDDATGATLGSFAIIAGSALDEDILSEISLLRAELDLLKRAFRRHCVETV